MCTTISTWHLIEGNLSSSQFAESVEKFKGIGEKTAPHEVGRGACQRF